MTPRERFYPESRFGGFTDIDGTIAFYTRVHSQLTPARWGSASPKSSGYPNSIPRSTA